MEALSQDATRVAVESWVRKVRKVGYQAYAGRLLGTAEYDRLERALREDGAVVALAVRRGVRAAMPFVAAFEDGLEVMTPDQLAQIRAVDLLGLNFGHLMHKLDTAIGERVWPQLPMDAVPTRHDDFLGLEQITEDIRVKVTTSATTHLTRVNEPLVRKLTGARDALKYSADGVAQAASSLVELIDRVLREGTEDRQVLSWIDRELNGAAGLTYVGVSGERRPTTRGSTLYFLYCGGSVARQPSGPDDGTGPSFLHEVIASVVVVARKKLQRLKHADSTDPVEREHLDKLLAAVEGAMWLGLWLHQAAPGVGVGERQSA